tara:strand:+ start:1519 stop:2703 length:1185 start_codon:yes stop_codon:yes gene_type:complete
LIRPKVSQLTGRSVGRSYQRLLTLNHKSGGNGTNLVEVKDGDGNTTFPIKVASNQIQITDGSNDFDVASHDTSNGLKLGGTLVTSTAAELNYNDTGAAVGTVVASKTVTADANKDVASFRNITLTGELDANSLDVEGDADINGTLEADAITVNGSTLNDVIDARLGSNIVATGALDSGSITSGFGNIDNGTSTLDTGAITASGQTIQNAGDAVLKCLTESSNGDNVSAVTLTRNNNSNNVANLGVRDNEDIFRITVGSNVSASYANLGDFTRLGINATGTALFNSSVGVGKIGANVLSMTTGTTITVQDNDGSANHVYVYDRGSGSGAIYQVGYAFASSIVVSAGGYGFGTSLGGSHFNLVSGANSHTITFQNNAGITRSVRIFMVSAGTAVPI